MRNIGVISLLWMASTLFASGQFIKFGPDKTVQLVITHSPQFGLNVKRVAFGKPGGSCESEASELVDRMILPDFQQNQMDVIERQALDQIMAEHNFNQTSYADASSAAELGRILGPSALIMVTVSSCRAEQSALFNDQRNFLNNNVTRTFISKTRYSFEGSVRIVDLTTGKVLGSHNFESKPEKSNQSTQGQPEYPAVDELKDNALEAVKFQIHSMFFPYGNPVSLQFYDDKECDLKQVYEQYKNGDHDGALHLVDQSLQQCKSGSKKEKSLARAYYDAGVLHCLNKDYDVANDLFKSAMDGKGAEAVAVASQSCQQSKASAAQLKVYLDRLDQIPAPAAFVVQSASTVPPAPVKQPGANTQPQPSVGGATPTTSPGTPSAEDRLNKLDSLYKRGLLTKKEYDAKRAEILKDL